MMKAEQLQIGDWVKSDSCGKVVSIHPRTYKAYGDYWLEVENEVVLKGFPAAAAEPVPLTEDILKANEFIGSTRDCYRYNCGVYLIDIRCEVGEVEIYEEKGHWTSGYVCKSVNVGSFNYVHELQHALRLCGFDYMANNFKIK